MESARSSVDSIQSDHNIVAVANKINQDIGESEGTVRQLNTWFSALDRHNYKKRNPWTPGMERAYDRYKDLAGRHGEAHTAFADYLQQTRRNATPEQHVRRADLAIAWGKAAIKYDYLLSKLCEYSAINSFCLILFEMTWGLTNDIPSCKTEQQKHVLHS